MVKINMSYNNDLTNDKVAIWFLGQSGYYIKSCDKTILIDPYLSDSVGKLDVRFSRITPIPVDPQELNADIFIITHDHLDHLDPETIMRYGVNKETLFIAPHLTIPHLLKLGINSNKIRRIDCGETETIEDVSITGIFALGTSKEVIDTTGYHIKFTNGKSVYHTSDTAWCTLLEEAAIYADVMLACINGKYGNMNAFEAAKLAKSLDVKYVIPNHYDVMALNSENPQTFLYLCHTLGIEEKCKILEVNQPFIF